MSVNCVKEICWLNHQQAGTHNTLFHLLLMHTMISLCTNRESVSATLIRDVHACYVNLIHHKIHSWHWRMASGLCQWWSCIVQAWLVLQGLGVTTSQPRLSVEVCLIAFCQLGRPLMLLWLPSEPSNVYLSSL